MFRRTTGPARTRAALPALAAAALLTVGAPPPPASAATAPAAASASVWTVRTRAELKTALANHGQPGAPKVIRVAVDIDGAEAEDGSGRLLGAQDYAPGFDRTRYLSCFGADGTEWTEWSGTRHASCARQRILRRTGAARQQAQIRLTVPGNTTLESVPGSGARLLGVLLAAGGGSNIVVRDLQLAAPVDHFAGTGASRADVLPVITGSHVLVDRCTFTDSRSVTAGAGFAGRHHP